ncbi:hypothetical protein G7Y79_00025g056840 [Physcia stellaris]|nr:hypothetical protein G7Y79_00025g056840 [Physcia stellaris]
MTKHEGALAALQAMREILRFSLPCDCDYCLQQYRSYDDQDVIFFAYCGETLEDADVARAAGSHARSISQHRDLLYRLIFFHGDAVARRWRKRTPQKRREFLKQVQPDLYPRKDPQLDLATLMIGKRLSEVRSYRKAYLLPYLNLEELSEDSSKLIRLLHHRIISHPKDWVSFDNAQIQPGWNQGCFAEQAAKGCVMMTDCEYGFWKPFSRHDVHGGSAYAAPRALLILEGQEFLLGFLVKVTNALLADLFSMESPTDHIRTATMAFRGFDESEHCRNWCQLVNVEQTRDVAQPWVSLGARLNSPFTNPSKFDMDIIIEIAESQTSEIQDDLWLLQTEPDFFHDRAKYHEASWSDKEIGHTRLRSISTTEIHNNIAYFLTIGVLEKARDWQWLLEECRAVKQIHEIHETQPVVDSQLQECYERSLSCLRVLLNRAWQIYQTKLTRALVRSEAFRSAFTTVDAVHTGPRGWLSRHKVQDENTFHERDRVGWCLNMLTKEPGDPFTFAPILVLQYLEHYLFANPSQLGRLDQEMQEYISNIAAIERMSYLLDLHRPYFKTPSWLVIKDDRQVWQFLSKKGMSTKVTLTSDYALGSRCFPLGKFCMPTGTKDKEWLAKSENAHKALANLWRTARTGYQRMLDGYGVAQAYIDPQLDQMRQCESPEYLLRLQEQRVAILSGLKASMERKHVADSYIQQDAEFLKSVHMEKVNIKKEIEIVTKSKTKSRPTLRLEDGAAPQTIECKDSEPPPVLYILKQRSTAYKAICKMLPQHMDHEQPTGEFRLAWHDFITVMAKFGFKAEYYGGSAFTFRGEIFLPEAPDCRQKRSITIHRPHPDDSLSSIMLHKIGRRLTRRFGWERANFQFTK